MKCVGHFVKWWSFTDMWGNSLEHVYLHNNGKWIPNFESASWTVINTKTKKKKIECYIICPHSSKYIVDWSKDNCGTEPSCENRYGGKRVVVICSWLTSEKVSEPVRNSDSPVQIHILIMPPKDIIRRALKIMGWRYGMEFLWSLVMGNELSICHLCEPKSAMNAFMTIYLILLQSLTQWHCSSWLGLREHAVVMRQ